MNLEYSDEQLALRDTIRQFLTARAGPSHARAMFDEPSGTTAALWRGLAKLGATGLLVPVAAGGTGLTMDEAGVVAEELGAAADPGPWISTSVLAPRALLRFGAEDGAMLGGIADGSVRVAVGPLSADSVVATGHGESVTLRAAPAVVADVEAADVLLVPARYDERWALFAVSTEDLPTSPATGIDPTRKSARVHLEDFPARLLAVADAGAAAALRDDALAITAAEALGAAQRLLDLTVAHAKDRRQFGQPIGSFQAVQQLCVAMFETVELFRGGVLRALWTADHSAPAVHHLAAARLKGFATRLASVGDNAVQVLGGIGYTWEHDAHLYLRRLLAFSGYLGRSDTYLTDLGASLLAETLRTSTETASA